MRGCPHRAGAPHAAEATRAKVPVGNALPARSGSPRVPALPAAAAPAAPGAAGGSVRGHKRPRVPGIGANCLLAWGGNRGGGFPRV